MMRSRQYSQLVKPDSQQREKVNSLRLTLNYVFLGIIRFQSNSLVPQYVYRRFPALPDFLSSSGTGTGSTQPREYN
jgi:hypothetical protein